MIYDFLLSEVLCSSVQVQGSTVLKSCEDLVYFFTILICVTLGFLGYEVLFEFFPLSIYLQLLNEW